jgi:hypothetical protein
MTADYLQRGDVPTVFRKKETQQKPRRRQGMRGSSALAPEVVLKDPVDFAQIVDHTESKKLKVLHPAPALTKANTPPRRR